MKKIVLLFSVLLLLLSCQKQNSVESSISLSSSLIVLQVGQDTIIEATVSPKSSVVEWTTEDQNVATVFAGIVTAIGEGATTISASANGKKANCTVIVESPSDQEPEDDNLSDAVRYLSRSAKRGVSFSSPFFVEDIALLSNGISWVYNWGPAPNSSFDAEFVKYDIDFFPMAWNANYNKKQITDYVNSHPNCKYILAYNEPNLNDQARMTPAEAASSWRELCDFSHSLGLKIVSPAMNYGNLDNYSDPIKWLDEFFARPEVSLDDVDAIALHCYMGNAGSMKSFIDGFAKYGKPIWMTEFCGWKAPVSSEKAQLEYMSEAVLMLEKHPLIERYAWFIARGSGSISKEPWNQLLTKTEPYTLSSQGLIYTTLSSFDKSVWLKASNHILMNTFSDICTLSDLQPIISPRFMPMNDAYNTLYMTNFVTNKWVEYQVDAEIEYNSVDIRYMAYMKTVLQIDIDGVATQIELPRCADGEWRTAKLNISLQAGKHVVKVLNISGNTDIHWLQFLK